MASLHLICTDPRTLIGLFAAADRNELDPIVRIILDMDSNKLQESEIYRQDEPNHIRYPAIIARSVKELADGPSVAPISIKGTAHRLAWAACGAAGKNPDESWTLSKCDSDLLLLTDEQITNTKNKDLVQLGCAVAKLRAGILGRLELATRRLLLPSFSSSHPASGWENLGELAELGLNFGKDVADGAGRGVGWLAKSGFEAVQNIGIWATRQIRSDKDRIEKQ